MFTLSCSYLDGMFSFWNINISQMWLSIAVTYAYIKAATIIILVNYSDDLN